VTTINVHGTCHEWVEIDDADGLVLRGIGAAVIAPPSHGEADATLQVLNSEDVLITGLTIEGTLAVIVGNCMNCRLQDSVFEGVTLLAGATTATLVKNTFRANGGWAAVATYDGSSVAVVNSIIEPGSSPPYWAGIQADGPSKIRIGGTTISEFGVGIAVTGGLVSLEDLSPIPGSDPDQTVVVEECLWSGIEVREGGNARLGGVTRLVGNSGQGIVVTQGSTSTISTDAEIVDTNGVGVLVTDNSHVQFLEGAKVVDTRGNGLVVVNNSTATGPPAWSSIPTVVSGSTAQDVFCDPTGVVSNAGQIQAPKVTCAHLNAGGTVPLPVP
jgi:hypothetical protein